MHHQSALPRNSKINFIRNERRHIQQRCSTQTTSSKHDRAFDNILHLNGFPENVIEETKRHHQSEPQTVNTEWLYFKIPFISDRPDYRTSESSAKKVSYYASLKNPARYSKTTPLSQHPKHMHETKLLYLKQQSVPTKQYRVPSHLQGT